MKPEARRRLAKDLVSVELAAIRRRVRGRKNLAFSVGLVVLAGLGLSRLATPSPPPAEMAADAPNSGSEERGIPEPPGQDADEALLEALSDAGPVIITLPDGSRRLYLTRR